MSHRREVGFRGSTNRRVTSYSPALENRAPWHLQALFGEQVCNTSCYMSYLQRSASLQKHGRYWAGYPEGCPPLGHHACPREFKQIWPSCLFSCGIETPKLKDRGSRLITEMPLGKEPVSWQACIQGCRCSLPKAKKHIITREVLRATGQFLLAWDTVGATAEDVRGAEGWGFQAQDVNLLSHSCCDSLGWEQAANVYKLGGRPWRT